MTNEELRTADSYRQMLSAHGPSFRALNWGSQGGQELRFSVLAGIADLNGKRVLDVGCGLGDFASWFEHHGIDVDYTGLDLTQELLDEAARRHPRRRLIQGSLLDSDLLAGDRFDYVFASGIFYSYPEGGDAWMQAAVTRMWQWAEKGLAFNSLSSWGQSQEAGEYYADPVEVLTFCRDLSPWVSLRHDYHARDFAVYLRRVSVGP
jgi:SAM-dependent methyltransferase